MRVRTVPKRVRDELYETLVTAWEQVVTTNSELRMLGPQVVCSDRVINLCKKAGRIQSVDDLKYFKGLRNDLYDLFFNIHNQYVIFSLFSSRSAGSVSLLSRIQTNSPPAIYHLHSTSYWVYKC